MVRTVSIAGFLMLFLGCSGPFGLLAQNSRWSGQVKDAQGEEPIQGVLVQLEGFRDSVLTDELGRFSLPTPLQVDAVACLLKHPGFTSQRILLHPTAATSDLGVIYMQPLALERHPEKIITLTEADIFDEEALSGSSDFLQASRDVFLSRVAFDFSPAFFRVRGLDNRYGEVYLNDIPMNRFYDGRPQWNNWGGLNDATRNQHFYMGTQVGPFGFGSLGGVAAIDISPAVIREGFRFTGSISDRNYQYRLLGIYNSGIKDNGLGITLAASRRFARQAYMDGTPYDASSFLASLGFKPSPQHQFSLLGIYASNYRGRSTAVTREVLEIGGRTYNPYWGLQDGKIRNARMRFICEPLVNFRYQFRGNSFFVTLAAAYQWGTQYRTRLAYFNAPNPDPTYYRNLPSFYWNGSLGPNLISADAARRGFRESPQISWDVLYQANRNRGSTEPAAYLLQADQSEGRQLSLNTHISLKLGKHWNLRSGILFRKAQTHNYARLEDLLGAEFHRDTDPFSETRNDLAGNLEKTEGAKFGYNYRVHARHWESFASLESSYPNWSAYVAASYGGRDYLREGLYQNARYPGRSLGKGRGVSLLLKQVKAGLSYDLDGRNRFQAAGALLQAPPGIRNLYVNPRDHSEVVPGVTPEKISAAELSYHRRGPKLTSRISAYYYRLQDVSEVNFFFTDSGHGSAFVQEVATGLDVLHKGLELGLEVSLGPSVTMTGVMALGDHRYASNPVIHLFHVPEAGEGKLPNEEGMLSLGTAQIYKRRVSAGPSRAVSLGFQYRAPAYWWAAITTNYLEGQYPDLSFIRYTSSFRLDPDTGQSAPVVEEDIREALVQHTLPPVYLLNMTGGKSWKMGSHYVSLFLSIVNLFDRTFFSGGYQQGRNGNYLQWQKDHLGGNPSFGTRFWSGTGRTFFLNLSWSFH